MSSTQPQNVLSGLLAKVILLSRGDLLRFDDASVFDQLNLAGLEA
jgi:hypothetical protein